MQTQATQPESDPDLSPDQFRCALCERIYSINDLVILHKEDRRIGFIQAGICIPCHDRRQEILLKQMMEKKK